MLKEPVERWRNVNGHNLLQLMYEVRKKYVYKLFSCFPEHRTKFVGSCQTKLFVQNSVGSSLISNIPVIMVLTIKTWLEIVRITVPTNPNSVSDPHPAFYANVGSDADPDPRF